MVKHTQTIPQLLSTNCLSVFDHFVGLKLKGLNKQHANLEFRDRLQISLLIQSEFKKLKLLLIPLKLSDGIEVQ